MVLIRNLSFQFTSLCISYVIVLHDFEFMDLGRFNDMLSFPMDTESFPM